MLIKKIPSQFIEAKDIIEWRHLILHRDKFQCQKCGLPHRNYFSIPPKLRPELEAHHIKSQHKNPELKLMVNNGITLCHFCYRNEYNGSHVK